MLIRRVWNVVLALYASMECTRKQEETVERQLAGIGVPAGADAFLVSPRQRINTETWLANHDAAAPQPHS